MSVDIDWYDVETEADEWNRLVERAPRSNPLFRAEALALQAAETGTTVHALPGSKDRSRSGSSRRSN